MIRSVEIQIKNHAIGFYNHGSGSSANSEPQLGGDGKN